MRNSILKLILFTGCMLFSFTALAQEKTVTGVVTDANNMPIPGVNVLIQGTTQGTMTDFDGAFSLEASPGDVLVFSYVGMETVEEEVDERDVYEVVLEQDAASLEEVVVVGYGTQRKADITGAVSSANLEVFREAPNVSIGQSLQGSVPGLNVGQVSSAGETPNISIRGRNSLGGNNDVLIVVDGIMYSGSLSTLDPDNIATIDVLKDASSTAIYGAQGANGVILITTKQGKRNRAPQITLSTSFATQTPTIDARPLDRAGYLEKVRGLYWNEAYLAPDYRVPNPDFEIADFLDVSLVDSQGNILEGNFNWWDAATTTGSIIEHDVTVSGGSEDVSYLLSAGYTDQEGYIINDTYNRNNIRANIEVDLQEWWTVGVQSFATFSDFSGAEPALHDIIRQPPLVEPFDENGELIPFPTGTIYSNPFMGSYVDDLDKGYTLFGNFYSDLEIPFIEGLSYRINFGNDLSWSKDYGSSIYDAGLTGSAYKNHSSRYNYTLDNILTYERTFAEDHDFTLTLLYGATERNYENTSARGEGFTDLTLSYHSLEQSEFQFVNSGAWREALNYQMGRINYQYQDKYLLTATIRRDGFSGFAQNNKWGIFPSVALGWVVSEEDFFEANFVDFLKLRAGHGTTGNLTDRYFSLSRIDRYPAYVFGDGGGTSFGQELLSLANSDLEWESTAGINLGVDFRLFSGRIAGNVEYYDTETENQLFSRSIPSISGVSSVNVNLGNIRNTGLEFSLTTRNIHTEDFSWSTTLNYAHNDNEILSLTGLDEDGDGMEDDIVNDNQFIGRPIGTIFDYEAGDIYQLGDDIPEGYYPGTRRVIDQDGDGEITPADRVFLGESNPAFRAGLINSVSYKNFSLNVFLNTVQGGDDGYLATNEPTYGGRQDEKDNMFNFLDNTDFWTPLNPDGINERYVTAPEIRPRVRYQRNFVRLQDVSLTYDVPTNLSENLGVADARVYVSGKNLATWTKWKGWDPETGDGLEDNGRPVLRGYSIGLNLTF